MNKLQMSLEEALRELELNRGVELEDVKRQYRRLAMIWHPDKNRSPAAGLKMVRINLAYESLTLLLSQGDETDDDHDFGSPFDDAGRYHDPFRDERQSRERPHYAKRGRNIARKIKVSMFEAAFGCSKEVEGEITDHCSTCGGSGRANGPGHHCSNCGGHGAFHRRQGGFGSFGYELCRQCNGSGVIFMACKACEGTGQGEVRKWAYQVTVKAGIRDGHVIYGSGCGGRSSSFDLRGDLVVSVQVIPHPVFSFNAFDQMEVEVPLSIWLWMAGGQVVVPLLDGAKLEQFPSMASVIRVPQQGWPTALGSKEREDLIVKLSPKPDNDLGPEQRKLLEQLAREHRNPVLDQWNQDMREWTFATPETRFAVKKTKKKATRNSK